MNKKKFMNRDRLIRAVTGSGHHRIVIVKSTEVVDTARKKHHLSLLTTVLLGRALTGSLLLASNLKAEERIRLKMEGNGPVRSLIVEATANGEVRGYTTRPDAGIDLEREQTLSDGIGIGLISVSKILYNKAQPVTGTVELVRGNVNEDLAHYLVQSEQIPSAVSLDVSLDEEGGVLESGGVLVQALPKADKKETLQLEENIRRMPLIGKQLHNGSTEELLETVTSDIGVKELTRYPVDFFCRCSKERFRRSLSLVNPDDLLNLDGATEEVVCHYCNSRYEFRREEIESIAQKAKVRQN